MFEREDDGSVRVLRMAHGKASALDLEFLGGLADELEGFAVGDSEALVLTGKGTIFSAGVDLVRLRDGGAEYVAEFLPALDRAFRALFLLEKPVVAAVNGHAIAGGCVLACACDLRLMATGKGRMGVPELLVGVPFPLLALEIVRRVANHVDEIALKGASFLPEEALARALVDELVDPDVLLERAVQEATSFARVPARAFASSKRGLRLPSLDLLERHEAAFDADVREAWTSAEVLGAVGDYVARTLGK